MKLKILPADPIRSIPWVAATDSGLTRTPSGASLQALVWSIKRDIASNTPVGLDRFITEVNMGFRFRRSVRIAKGVRLNFSNSGMSVSFGGKGATVNVNKKGVRTTVGLPGTGVSYSKFSPHKGDVPVGVSAPARTYSASEMNVFLFIALSCLLLFGWGHAWALYAFIPIVLFFALAINADRIQRRVRGFPPFRVRTSLLKTLEEGTHERVRFIMGQRSQLVAGPFSVENRSRIDTLDEELAQILPSSFFEEPNEIEEPEYVAVPLLTDRGLFVAMGLGALISLYGFGSCVSGALRGGASGIVNDEYVRCEELHSTNSVSEAEYNECIAAVQKLETSHGPR